jgi:murein DD-endopeptidase MepM/ murein hydrolase activator NlpD
MPPCALPPVDQAISRIGRGFGVGYNARRDRTDQFHAGMDFVGRSGSAILGQPVLAPIPGRVSLVTLDEGRVVSPEAAQGGSLGQVRGMHGYGNAVVLEHAFDVPGLPNPFWTLYAHLGQEPTVRVGQEVAAGALLGQVGRTTNGQFPNMGPHLHFEVRRASLPGSYDRDSIDPAVLFEGLGIDWIGHHTEIEREVGGSLLIREDGPSGPATCRGRTLAGMRALAALGLAVPDGYVDPASPMLRDKYLVRGGSIQPRPDAQPPAEPPDYSPDLPPNQPTLGLWSYQWRWLLGLSSLGAIGALSFWIGQRLGQR